MLENWKRVDKEPQHLEHNQVTEHKLLVTTHSYVPGQGCVLQDVDSVRAPSQGNPP